MSKPCIFLMGPTACGKTDLAVALCQKFPLEVISVDSAMVYRGMDIGTAKPSRAELKITPHRLINLRDPETSYSAGDFCEDAHREMNTIFQNHHTPLLVGGTMLYFHALLFGLANLPTANNTLRNQLLQEAQIIGWTAMHQKLQNIDSMTAQKIRPQDSQRIQRALEVFYATGKPLSVLQKKNQLFLSENNVVTIALIPQNRTWLHDRIAKRFDHMLAQGFLDEVRVLRSHAAIQKEMTSMRIVGYRQAWEYLDGEINFEAMREKVLAATRQFAKRQLTWLRSWKNKVVFDPQDPQVFKQVSDRVEKYVNYH